MPLPVVAGAAGTFDSVIAEIQSMPADKRQAKIDSVYDGLTKAGVKAAFTKRLQSAGLPLPVKNKPASAQDALIAVLQARLTGIAKH